MFDSLKQGLTEQQVRDIVDSMNAGKMDKEDIRRMETTKEPKTKPPVNQPQTEKITEHVSVNVPSNKGEAFRQALDLFVEGDKYNPARLSFVKQINEMAKNIEHGLDISKSTSMGNFNWKDSNPLGNMGEV